MSSTHSPYSWSRSRDVTSTVAPGAAPSSSAITARSATRCSALSKTTSSCWSATVVARPAAGGSPSASRSAPRICSVIWSGPGRTASSGTQAAPSANGAVAGRVAATSTASRVLPLPPEADQCQQPAVGSGQPSTDQLELVLPPDQGGQSGRQPEPTRRLAGAGCGSAEPDQLLDPVRMIVQLQSRHEQRPHGRRVRPAGVALQPADVLGAVADRDRQLALGQTGPDGGSGADTHRRSRSSDPGPTAGDLACGIPGLRCSSSATRPRGRRSIRQRADKFGQP